MKFYTRIICALTLLSGIFAELMFETSNAYIARAEHKTKKSKMQGKIVNGIPISIRHFPFLAQITFGGHHMCGGVIITTRVIITAGHCTVRLPNFNDSFRYGILLGSSYSEKGYSYEVIKTLTHKNYTTAEFDYMFDLGMMMVSKNIVLGPTVKLAKIVTHQRWRNQKRDIVVAGYGTIKESGAKSKVLRMTRMHYVDSKVCNRSYSDEAMPVTDYNFCLIGVGFTSDCNGDSGSAVIWRGTHVIGLVTTGRTAECGSDTVPSMYTNLANHATWIKTSLQKLQGTMKAK